ncbi:MAG: hypothetical protein AAB881_01480 [Patescibacteria group bacterium]
MREGELPPENSDWEKNIFQELGRDIEQGNIYLKETNIRLSEALKDLQAAENQLAVYLDGNSFAADNQLKPMATKEEIEELDQNISGMRNEVKIYSKLQDDLISTIDRIQEADRKLLDSLLHAPAPEDNPDDNIK